MPVMYWREVSPSRPWERMTSLVGSFDTIVYSPLTIVARIIKNDKVGYIDLNGNEIIPPQYQSISQFKNGVALFLLNDETAGLINYKRAEYTIKNSSCVQLNMGKFIIKYGFNVLLSKNGTSHVCQEVWNRELKNYYIIDSNLQIVFNDTVNYNSCEINSISKIERDKLEPSPLACSMINNKSIRMLYNDFRCNLAIVDSFCNVDTFIINNGKKHPNYVSKKGAINKECKMIIPFIYDDLSNFSNGYSIFKKGEKSGIIDSKGNVIFEKENIDLSFGKYGNLNTRIDDGVLLFVDNKYTYKYGVMTVNGEVLIKPTYASIYGTKQLNDNYNFYGDYDDNHSFENGIARYEKTGKIDKLGYDTNIRRGLIDKYGNEYLIELKQEGVKIKNRENITALLDNFVFFYNEPNQNNNPKPCKE